MTIVAKDGIELQKLVKISPFDVFTVKELREVLETLAGVFVRSGKNAEGFCTLRSFTHNTKKLLKISFNNDLRICVEDLKDHLRASAFVKAIEASFRRFDLAYGVDEALDDLSFPTEVAKKVTFVAKKLLPYTRNKTALGKVFCALRQSKNPSRARISAHFQNWHFEIMIHLCGLNSAEDIQTRFKERFETSGHKLRSHAPYGDHAKTVAFMLQGRDVCELWSKSGTKRTLAKDEFRDLCWETMAQCIVDALSDRGSDHKIRSGDDARTAYLQNKSMRIISSDLNGFYILMEHYLGDLCHLQFLDEEYQEEKASDVLRARVCPSWQTDMVKSLWGSVPLETWVEGVSKDGKWLIKVQSSQDGNEGHKTKELSGRSRAMHIKWNPQSDPADRSAWTFVRRDMPKTALVLDGDWDRTKKKNLYEAGWNWVGDVSQLGELRAMITKK